MSPCCTLRLDRRAAAPGHGPVRCHALVARLAVAVAATGGLIGISLFAPALPSADLVALGKSVSYTVKLLNQAGIDGARHVAIGSDFDGAVRTVIDASGWARITAELMHHAHGLSPEQVEWIVGANTRRFFSDNLPC